MDVRNKLNIAKEHVNNGYKKIVPEHLRKPMGIMLLVLGVLFGAIFGYKLFGKIMMNMYFASQGNPVVTVSTAKAKRQLWQPDLKSVGNTRTLMGVNVTAQLGGMVQQVYFTPGSVVKEGTVLVQQNADPNIAQLHSLQANAELARITYERDKAQYTVHGVSKQQVDSDFQNLKSIQAQVAQQAAIVDQLTIKAPFTGRLGISQAVTGQYLNPGDTVVTLQSLDPIWVDFYLPQQTLSQVKVGQDITMTVDSYPGRTFEGVVTTINPVVDVNSRNFEVEATMPNPTHEILPGMFTNVTVLAGEPKKYLTLPITAVSFNPYGELVYLVNKGKDKKGNDELTVNQVFVTTGETRGDEIIILKGLNEGDEVVTSGQLKLKNGSRIAVNNTVQPSDSRDPAAPNRHSQE